MGIFLVKMKKALLIGGTGNLGSAIIKSNLFKNIWHPSKKNLNLLERTKIKTFLKKNFDIIINCSGYPRVKLCEKNTLKSFELNLLQMNELQEVSLIYLTNASRAQLRC